MTSRYALYVAARDRHRRYAMRAFADSVRTGTEGTDDRLHELADAEYEAFHHLLRGNPCAAAVYAAKRWWARESGAERDRVWDALHEADARWHIVLAWYDAGCPGSGQHPAAQINRDLQQREDAAMAAWDADWRAALLALERAHTTRRETTGLRRAA